MNEAKRSGKREVDRTFFPCNLGSMLQELGFSK